MRDAAQLPQNLSTELIERKSVTPKVLEFPITTILLPSRLAAFQKSPVELSYSISAGIAGVVAGPLLLVPITSIVGRSSLVFWSQVVVLGCNIWGPLMAGSNDYIPFVMSRMVAGIFGSIPAVLASGYVMDLYFLHQRGKAFTVLEVAYLSGFLASPALGGFIVDSKPWPFVFWWLVAVNGFAVLLGWSIVD